MVPNQFTTLVLLDRAHAAMTVDQPFIRRRPSGPLAPFEIAHTLNAAAHFGRVHGEQYTAIRAPLPTRATLTHRAKILHIFDKGEHALVVTAIRSLDERGQELTYNELTTFVRGGGGLGGERGPQRSTRAVPLGAPDGTVREKVGANQALRYRLSGGTNPLHVDPEGAKAAGFDRSILHGLCTFGCAGRHVLRAVCDDDPRQIRSIRARFSESVFPGDTLVTEIWRAAPTEIAFRTSVEERGKVVLSGGVVELSAELAAARAPG